MKNLHFITHPSFGCIVLFIFWLGSTDIIAQNLPKINLEQSSSILKETNSNHLLARAKEDSIEYYLERAKAEKLADSLGLPKEGTLPGGGRFELQGFDDAGQLKYYKTFNRGGAATISTDEVWPGGDAGTSLTGEGWTLAVWDGGRVLSTHTELSGKVIQGDSGSDFDNHATHVTGTCIAKGNNSNARGMAYNADAITFDWNNDLSEIASMANAGIRVSNHSYGLPAGWEELGANWHWFGFTPFSNEVDYKFGYYDSDAQAIDDIVSNAPFYLPVIAAGNDRNDHYDGAHLVLNSSGNWVWSSAQRPPDGGFSGYDCINNMGTSKNSIVVGAVEELPNGYTPFIDPSDVEMSSFSSWGPTNDGRIKPDLVAKGVGVLSCNAEGNFEYDTRNGTSMAAPMVTGSILLIHEHVDNLFSGAALRSSAMRALLIHTADECGTSPGPDYRYGWGLMNTQKAIEFLNNDDGRNWFSSRDSIVSGTPRSYTFQHDGDGGIKVTMAWTDLPGNVCSPPNNTGFWVCDNRMLVNDLDIRLVNLDNSTVYSPWRLNPNAPNSPANRGDNDRDNIEQIHFTNLPAGNYAVTIDHKGNLQGGKQIFSLMLSGIGAIPEMITCDEAIDIQCGQSITGSTSGNPQPVPPCGTSLNTAPGQWYRYLGTGGQVTITTCSPTSNYDTKLAVFSGNCDNLDCVSGIDDDNECTTNDLLSSVDFFAESGTEYFIYVTGFDIESGIFELSLECSGSNCNSPTGLTATDIGYAHFILDWDEVPDADFYEARVRETPNGTWYTSNEYDDPGVIFGNRVPNTSYEVQVRSKCNNNYSDWSDSEFLTTLGAGNPYCFSYGIAWNYWIDRIVFAGIDNDSGTNFGYNDYSSQYVGEVEAGESYVIELYPGQSSSTPQNTGWWQIWIDWNKDNIFSPPGETAHSHNAGSSTDINGNILIPENTPPGDYKMRVSYRITNNAHGPCITEGNMEVEDYTVRVIESIQPPVANFTASVVCGEVPLSVSFTDISSNNPGNWQWDFGDGQTSSQQNPTITYTTPGTYTVSLIAENEGGTNTEEKVAFITVVSPVTLSAPSGTEACINEGVMLVASGADSYSWTGPGLNNTAGSTVVASPSQPGTYVYQAIGTTNGCESQPQSISVIFSPLPQTSIAASSTDACIGETITLSASGAMTYSWAGQGLSATTGNIVQVAPTQPGTYAYQVVGTSGNCSSDAQTVSLTFSETPQATVTASGTNVCIGDPVTLNASGATTYAWSGPGLNSSSGNIVQATPTQPGTYVYEVIGSIGNCTSQPVGVSVTFSNNLDVQITASHTTACEGEPVTLTASGADSYTWSGPDITNTMGAQIQVSSQQSGSFTYEVVGTSGNCSSSVVSSTIQFSPTPAVSIESNSTQPCLGESVILSASGASSYSWQGPGLSGNTGATVSATPTLPGNNTYQVVGTNNGCESSPHAIILDVQNPPLLSISASNTVSCLNQPISLTATGASDYTWMGIGLNSTSGSTVTASPNQAGSYSYQVIGNNGSCISNPQTINIQFNSIPDVVLSANTSELCQGESIQLTASGANTYSWQGPGINSNSGSTVMITLDTSGVMVFQVTGTANGCTSHPDSVEVIITPSPELTAELSSDPVCLGDTLTLTAAGATQYFWNGPGLLSFSGPSVQAVPSQIGELTFQLTGIADGCEADPISVTTTVESIPLSISLKQTGDCSDESILFEAEVTNGGAQPNVLWHLNNDPVWSGLNYTLFGAEEGDEVFAEVTATNPPSCTFPLSMQSDVITIECTTLDKEFFSGELASLFPNPNSGKFTLNLNSPTKIEGSATLFNSLGQLIQNYRIDLDAGNHMMELEIDNATSGIYYCLIKTSRGQKAIKFVID